MERIFLIGYMGSGKTTVGKLLAKSLSLEFIDLDAYIENKHRKSVPTLFSEKGENSFRKIERQALQEVSTFENVLISTGGGVPCFFDNMDLMNRVGTTIYIEATPEDLAARLLASKTVRPLIAGKTRDELIPFIREHLAQRERFYKRAHIVYFTSHMLSKSEIHVTVCGIEEQIINRKNHDS